MMSLLTKLSLSCIAGTLITGNCNAAEQVQLFNGKDLTGWKGQGYEVKDGIITCTPKGRTLYTEKQYSNYVFRFEFKLPPGGNNGIAIHYPGDGNH